MHSNLESAKVVCNQIQKDLNFQEQVRGHEAKSKGLKFQEQVTGHEAKSKGLKFQEQLATAKKKQNQFQDSYMQ